MYQPTRSLVTGASSGLGVVFARRLAARGSALVLVARRRERLETLAAELRTAHGVEVQVVDADLSAPGAGAELHARIDGVVDTLVNNAGFGTSGRFAETAPERLLAEVDLDVRAVVDLSRTFLPAMLEARHGAVVNVASTASYQPIPGMAVYGAAKAFVRSFSEALWDEARPHGVKVLALSPGATRTEFFDIAGDSSLAVGRLADPERVVDAALRELDRRRSGPGVIPGLGNRIAATATRLVPQRIVAPATRRIVGALPD